MPKKNIDDLPETEPHGKRDDYAEVLPSPNIIFCGKTRTKNKDGKFVVADAEPPANIQDGREKITLPAAEDQKAGFYHEKASRIINAMPKMYKPLKRKGVK